MSFDTFTSDLVSGIARYLQAESRGVWSPDGGIAEGQTAIVAGDIPAQPERVIALTPYPVTDDPVLSDAVIGLNVRMRGDGNVLTVMGMSDGVFASLHGLEHFVVTGEQSQVHLNLVWRQSATGLGPDSNGRHERSENYYIRVNRPHPRLE